MTKEKRLAKSRAKLLWCVHILGPDDLVAHESYAAAEKHANELNDYMHGPDVPDLDVMCLSIVAMWPGTAAEHAEGVLETRAEEAKRAERIARHTDTSSLSGGGE